MTQREIQNWYALVRQLSAEQALTPDGLKRPWLCPRCPRCKSIYDDAISAADCCANA